MLWLTQMMGYNEYIPLIIRQMNDGEENLYPMSLIRSTFSVMHEMDTQYPTKCNALNVNTIQNYLQVASRITIACLF